MDLKDFLASRSNRDKEYYWSLVVEPGWIQAGIWEIVGEKAQVVSVGPPTAWETDMELIGAADAALSSVVQNLPEDIKEPSQTVFGVPPSWVDKGQIKEEFLSKIKSICSDLSLNPTGFVVLTEAIAHYIKTEEGAPLNAVIVGIGRDFLEIAVFKLGNLLGNMSVARSVSIVDDVAEGLSRFASAEALPSRIIVYDGKEGELEDAKQLLIETNWDSVDKVKFLHTPKVEILQSEKKVLATALAGASEIANIDVVEKIEKKEPLEEMAQSEYEHKNIVIPEKELSAEDLGFVLDEDVASKKLTQEDVAKREEKERLAEPMQPLANKTRNSFPLTFVNKVKFAINKVFANKGGKIVLPGFRGDKLFVSGIALLLAIFVLFFVFWWFYPKAVVRIYISPKKFEEKVSVAVDPLKGEVDLTNMVLPGEILTAEVSGDKTKQTTGTKKVGDRAKGSVKIQNGTSSIINLKEGALLLAANSLEYNLASSASVSAALSPSIPGTQVVDVIAYDIGAEYNLAKDESFKVANYPKADVDAVAVSDFTGGSSREITAVSADDQKSLENDLLAELLKKARSDFETNLSSEKYLIDNSLTATSSSKMFSNKVGDEATNIKLSLDEKVNALAVAKKDLVAIAMKVLEGSVPSGFVLRGDQLLFEFDSPNDQKEKSSFELRIIANFLPEIDTSTLAGEITGKNSLFVEQHLSLIAGFSRAEINIRPRFPGKLGTLPRISKNITIELVGER